jgi:Fe(3+) dicitrate transport protein
MKSFLILSLFLSLQAHAENVAVLPTIQIFDQKNALDQTPGSGVIIDEKSIQETAPLSTQDMLRKVPGVQVVETEGYGFYPRITIRGLGSDMSKKVLLLEDGAPIALGPFTDPAAYYSPPVERFERIEILKGSGALRFGPSTIGGAINYITRNPPAEPAGKILVSGGEQGYRNVFAEYGGSWDKWVGGVSVLRKEGDGWRDMPFELTDVVAKAGRAIGDKNFVSIKATYYDLEGSHTYTGLTQREYREDYRQNKAKNDKMFLERKSVDLNHDLEISAKTRLKTLVYWNQVTRDWWRESFTFNAGTGLNEAQDVNQGRLRDFDVYGVDSRLVHAHDLFSIKSELELGIRYHNEVMENFRVDGIAGAPDRYRRNSALDPREDDTRKAQSVALFVENKFHVTEKLAVTPGVRVESYEQERDIAFFGSTAVNEKSKISNTEIVPGIGAVYKLTKDQTVFAGVHRGFAPPRVQDVIDNDGVAADLDAERSVNFELGTRGRYSRGNYELTLFRLDFSNQLVQASQSGGAGTQLTNAGKTLNQGIEMGGDVSLNYGFSLAANYTWLETAKLDSTRIIGGVDRKGNRLTYAPEHLANVRLVYNKEKWNANFGFNYVSEQFADLQNTKEASANGLQGEIPSYMIWDITVGHHFSSSTRVYSAVRNLFDKQYISSRAPTGIFSGMGRMAEVGLEVKF